jgi:hypothetical protein
MLNCRNQTQADDKNGKPETAVLDLGCDLLKGERLVHLVDHFLAK